MDALMQHVQHSLDVGEFGSLAALLDHAELEVRSDGDQCFRSLGYLNVLCPILNRFLQDPAIFETKKWPHAIHLLSHIYALQL